MQNLPLISLAGLTGDDAAFHEQASKLIGQAAEEIGFFRVCDHGISTEMIAATYRVAEQFFALPIAEKERFYIGANPSHRGYVPFHERGEYADETHRYYEAFDLGHEAQHPRARHRLQGPNVWPELPGFRQVVAEYFNKVSHLALTICGCLERYLGLPADAMTDQMTMPLSQLRLLHYVRQGDLIDPRSVNMGAHTDYECLTVLHTRNTGLQVLTRDNVWTDVPADPDVLVVNVGDMIEAWSNGILRSTPHRVLNMSAERFSLPFFLAPNYETIIQPFPSVVTAERPDRYPPFQAGTHLERMLARDFPYLKRHLEQARPSQDLGGIQNPFESRIREGAE